LLKVKELISITGKFTRKYFNYQIKKAIKGNWSLMEENHAPWIGVGALVIAWALLSILQIITKRNQANLIKSFHQIIKCKTKILFHFSVPMIWLTTPSLSGNKFSGFCSKLQSLNPSHCKKIATFPLFISLLTTFKLFKPSKFFFFYFLLSVVLLCLKFLKTYTLSISFLFLFLSLSINFCGDY
jgi:hypothetical protein